MKPRIAPFDGSFPKHNAAMEWVDALIFDLKLQMLGREPHSPITMERLDEWHKEHYANLNECRSGGIKY